METIIKALVLVTLTASVASAGRIPKQFGMPIACAGKNYCTTKHQLYPTEAVERVVKELKLALFNGGQTPLVVRVDDDEIDADCAVDDSEQNNLIFEVTDENNNVRVVVQSSAFTQLLKIKFCTQPGRITQETLHFSQSTVEDINLECVDTYFSHGFYVLSKDWKNIEKVNVDVPVGCACKINDKK